MLPRKNEFDIFDHFWDFPFTKKLGTMKTDISETEQSYLLDIELPGYQKEDIKLEVSDGYLIVSVSHCETEEKTTESYLQKERFSGKCERSFYIGKSLTSNDIKAKLTNGLLHIELPKKEDKSISEKQYIEIEE